MRRDVDGMQQSRSNQRNGPIIEDIDEKHEEDSR